MAMKPGTDPTIYGRREQVEAIRADRFLTAITEDHKQLAINMEFVGGRIISLFGREDVDKLLKSIEHARDIMDGKVHMTDVKATI